MLMAIHEARFRKNHLNGVYLRTMSGSTLTLILDSLTLIIARPLY
jgi:hypothetical protein